VSRAKLYKSQNGYIHLPSDAVTNFCCAPPLFLKRNGYIFNFASFPAIYNNEAYKKSYPEWIAFHVLSKIIG
jgi:hypothetical protein